MMKKRWCWLLFFVVLALLGGAMAVLAQQPAGVGVYYIGPDDVVAQAIRQSAPYIFLVDRVELAQVYVINNAPLERLDLQSVGRQVLREDVGLVVFSGPFFPQNSGDLRALLGVGAFGLASGEMQPRSVEAGEEPDSLLRAIAWSSAPELQARTVITNPNLLLPIVETTTGEPVVQRIRGREELQVFVVGAWLDDPSNEPWTGWPYFNYVVYRLIAEAGGASRVLSFGDYPGAPVPQDTPRLVIALAGAGTLLLTLAIFFLVRRWLFLNPAAPETLCERPVTRSQETPEGWDAVGFHRPLAALLFLVGGGVVLVLPLLGYQLYFLPRALVPLSQTLDFWDLAGRWLLIPWLILDAGTGVAAVWYFATLRPTQPRAGFRYFQFYLWWQLLSGAAQLAVIAWLSTVILPGTSLAHLSFYFIARALIQFPGFFAVFRLFFRALQRLDYEQLLVLLLSLAPLAFQTVAILLLRRWGGAPTGVGEALGSVFGLGLGLYLTEGLVFLVGLLLYRRLGFALWPLFRPTFDRRIAGRMLSFGLRMTLGSLVVPVAYFVQAVLLSGSLSDYGEVGGAWSIALSLFPVYDVLAVGLYNGLMPAVAAAFTHGYRTLTRYYASQGLRYGMWFSLFFLATAGALGDRFVLGLLGERYADAAEMVGPLLIWGALQWLPWSAEAVLVGIGRPALRSALLVSEYLVRFGLLFIVRSEYGIWGLVAAFALASLLRGLLGWLFVQRLAVNVRLPFWQMAVAPAGAALVVYNLLRGVGDIYWQLDVGVTLIFSIVVLLPALPLYGFFTAFLGGWDDEGLAELRRAVAISGLGIPLGRLLYEAVHLGARLSPLHGLFSHQLYRWADEEAEALTLRRPVIR